MKMYVVRHGETLWNIDHRVQGRTDIALSDRGKEEASELIPLMRTLDIDVVISSPLVRAKETAKILTEGLLPINTDDRIIERSWGMNEGVPVDQTDTIDCWDVLLNTNVQNIERVQDLMDRVSNFIEDIKVRYKDKNVLISTHSAVSRVIHYLIEGIPNDYDLTKIEIPNLRIIEYDI